MSKNSTFQGRVCRNRSISDAEVSGVRMEELKKMKEVVFM